MLLPTGVRPRVIAGMGALSLERAVDARVLAPQWHWRLLPVLHALPKLVKGALLLC